MKNENREEKKEDEQRHQFCERGETFSRNKRESFSIYFNSDGLTRQNDEGWNREQTETTKNHWKQEADGK